MSSLHPALLYFFPTFHCFCCLNTVLTSSVLYLCLPFVFKQSLTRLGRSLLFYILFTLISQLGGQVTFRKVNMVKVDEKELLGSRRSEMYILQLSQYQVMYQCIFAICNRHLFPYSAESNPLAL